MNVVCLLLWVALSSSVIKADENKPRISPKIAHRNPKGNISVMCISSLALNDCQFKVWMENGKENSDLPLIALAKASQQREFHSARRCKLFDADYYEGKGLANGECGLKMDDLRWGRYFVGCRVRNDTSGWMYEYMAFIVQTNSKEMQFEENKKAKFKEEVVELNKDSEAIVFDKTESLRECKIYFPNQASEEAAVVSRDANASVSTATYTALLSGNTCTAWLLNVTEHSNGVLWCMFTTDGKVYKAFGPRILKIKVKPKAPTLMLSYTEGQTLTATCIVEDARPAARIVWKLGDDVIRNDTADDDKERAWHWPWNVTSITQVLTWKLTNEDEGKILSCQVFHPNSSVHWISASARISVPANKAGTVVTVVMVMLLLAVGGVVLFVWLRRKRAIAIPTVADANRFSILAENDLYESFSAAQCDIGPTTGVRETCLAENPYDEAVLPGVRETCLEENPYDEAVLPDGGCGSETCNTVQYEEIVMVK